MGKVIGYTILLCIFCAIIAAYAIKFGAAFAATVWLGSLGLTVLIAYAVWLIVAE